ncbi:hypothetical protein AB0I22_14120 [Streptomyces sp. NPDC050610]|uniref:hypothetical protein n=1 Tax=Streptomyces sp. NPDC050610 TaxID=3157097 RepID=UPI00343396B0
MALVSETRGAGTVANDPLVSYTIQTTPDPLKASPENPDAPEEIGELLIVASRRDRTPADVKWIKVQVLAGAMSPDLATDLAKITAKISLSGWTVALNSSTKEFVFTPTAEFATIGPDTGFTIQLAQIPINRKVGTSPIKVTENSRAGSAAFLSRDTAFDVGKFPADFYLRNFICEPLVIDNGGEVKLTWERSANAAYELLYGDVHIPDVTNDTTRPITNIKSDTTFYLRGTAGDPSNPVIRILSTQVTVRRPDLDTGNLTVNGATALNGPVTMMQETQWYTAEAGKANRWEAVGDGYVEVLFPFYDNYSATITIHRPKDDFGWNSRNTIKEFHETFRGMVRDGSRISVETDAIKNYCQVSWVPFGAGSLKPLP